MQAEASAHNGGPWRPGAAVLFSAPTKLQHSGVLGVLSWKISENAICDLVHFGNVLVKFFES